MSAFPADSFVDKTITVTLNQWLQCSVSIGLLTLIKQTVTWPVGRSIELQHVTSEDYLVHLFLCHVLHSTSPAPARRCVSLDGWCCCRITPPGPTYSSSMTQTKVNLSPQPAWWVCLAPFLKSIVWHFAGNVYKFQTSSRFSAIIWHKNLEEACRSSRPQVRPHLMASLWTDETDIP